MIQILVMCNCRLGYARISHGGLSDTEVQLAKFEMPTDKVFNDNTRTTTSPTKIDKKIHFNKM